MLIIILASITTLLALAVFISFTINPLFKDLIDLDDTTTPEREPAGADQPPPPLTERFCRCPHADS